MGTLAAPKSWDPFVEQVVQQIVDRFGSHPAMVLVVQQGIGVQKYTDQTDIVFQKLLPLRVRPVGTAGIAEEAPFLAVIQRSAGHLGQRLHQNGSVELLAGGAG